jgi:predicted RNase H-like nuclease (RuvC/YqgF family)
MWYMKCISELHIENRRLQAEIEKLTDENMNLTAVLRTLRKNLREDNEKLATISRELWLWKNGKYQLDCVAVEGCKSEAEVRG